MNESSTYYDPKTGRFVELGYPFVYCFIFGGLYFLWKGLLLHGILHLLLCFITGGIAWLIYPFFAKTIIKTHYLKLNREQRGEMPIIRSKKMNEIYQMDGAGSTIKVYNDRLIISPNGLLGFMTKGLKGDKTIPFSSITAIQFKKAGALSGYIQFSIFGGKESTGGILDATTDENTFMFRSNNELAESIKDYIEKQIYTIKTPSQGSNIADELLKLSNLREKGILTEDEFQKAKLRIINT